MLAKPNITVILAVAGACATLAILSRKRKKSSIPRLHSWIPYVGQAGAFFAGAAPFCHNNGKIFGGSFVATIFGSDWYFLFKKEDVQSALTNSEKDVSMYQAISAMAGKFLPHEDHKEFTTPEMMANLSRGVSNTKWDGVSSTPQVKNSVRPSQLAAWVPGIRKLMRARFATLPDSGELDLFVFCRDLISEITLFALFGDAVPASEMDRWLQLLKDAEIEAAFDGTMALGTMVELAVYGERKIYGEMRTLIYKFLDAEIERVRSGQPLADGASVMSAMVQSFYNKGDQDLDFIQAARRRIANDIIFFNFAAITNSFGMAAWTLFHVLRNTAGCGDRVRAEMQQVPDDSPSLPELEMTIQEIARLYTPGALMRLVVKPWVMPSTQEEIPAGSMLAIPVYDIHRDPQAFSKPLDFDPQRFDPNGRDEGSDKCGLLTFGGGIHPCVGRRFAILEVSLFVSEALKAFEWQLVGDASRPEDAFTQSCINVPRHPALNSSQQHSLWLPTGPVLAHLQRRQNPGMEPAVN